MYDQTTQVQVLLEANLKCHLAPRRLVWFFFEHISFWIETPKKLCTGELMLECMKIKLFYLKNFNRDQGRVLKPCSFSYFSVYRCIGVVLMFIN